MPRPLSPSRFRRVGKWVGLLVWVACLVLWVLARVSIADLGWVGVTCWVVSGLLFAFAGVTIWAFWSPLAKRVPENAPGDFYVQADRCLRCCLPHDEAPGLMNDLDGEWTDCYFRRQPQTAEEIEQAIKIVQMSCVEAARYGGNDDEIVRRLYEAGRGRCCDNLPPDR